jgi:hypothetical protein
VTDDVHDLLRGIERDRLRALAAADADTADVLHAADYQLITPSGTPLTKSEYLGSIAAGQMRYLAFEPVSPIAVRSGPQTAVLRYQAYISIEQGDDRADLTCWHTDYYELRDGRWQAVWSQATRIASPD